MNFNNSRLVDHKPMKFGTFVPYMYRFVIIVKYLTNFFKLEWNLGIKSTLRFFFLSVYIKFHLQKLKKNQIKKTDIFHISAQNIDCGYSLEPPRRGGSNVYPQSMFLAEMRKIMYPPVNPSFTI